MKSPVSLIRIPQDDRLRETEKAICFNVNESSAWIPKSQMKDIATVHEEAGSFVTFWLPDWLVKDKGLDHLVYTGYEPYLWD